MNFNLVFAVSNAAAMAGWIALIFLPRWPLLARFLRNGLIAGLSLLYAVLVFVYFFRVQGGGFNSIAAVRALFMSDPVLVAGWAHYLAFDLFVGTWIAAEADKVRMSRLLQAPILLLTFMFGPAGYFAFLVMRQTKAMVPAETKGL
jgi:Domain of unknown function (DUF4281)